MPELFPHCFIPHEENGVGTGGVEKNVYRHPEDPSRVLGIYHEKYIDRHEQLAAKGDYYLSAILELLLPDSFPHLSHISINGEGQRRNISDFVGAKDPSQKAIEVLRDSLHRYKLDDVKILQTNVMEVADMQIDEIKNDNQLYNPDTNTLMNVDLLRAFSNFRSETWRPIYSPSRLYASILAIKSPEKRQDALKKYQRLAEILLELKVYIKDDIKTYSSEVG